MCKHNKYIYVDFSDDYLSQFSYKEYSFRKNTNLPMQHCSTHTMQEKAELYISKCYMHIRDPTEGFHLLSI